MPRVRSNADVTLVVLVYRSLKWLRWCMEGVDASKNTTLYRWLVVANDGTDEVRSSPLVDVDWQNADPSEHYINRVYRAWNEGVRAATTETVVMLNSDMYPADYWLDELIEVDEGHEHVLPTSALVESGRIPSGMPELVHDFGQTTDGFDAHGFRTHADTLRRPGVIEPGRLYMPILVHRQEFFDLGGYPEGNPPGTTGDKDLVARYAKAGIRHVTACGSIVYHTQEGEMREPNP